MPPLMKPVNTISRCQEIFRLHKIEAEELRPGHYPFILTICRQPGLSQDAIAREIFVDKSTVARVLAHLEKAGYVTRIACEKDKRRSLVYPTEKMLGILPEVKQVSTEWRSLLSEGIPEAELTIFHSVLERMEMRAREIVERQEEEK